MKKKLTLAGFTICTMMIFSSCGTVSYQYLPKSTNMIHTVSFEDLQLTTQDYVILDRVEADSRIAVTIEGSIFTIQDPDGSFSLKYVYNSKTNTLSLFSFEGVLRAGFLSEFGNINSTSPEEIANRIALYRLINLVREQGGDYVIEPVFSTNVEGETSKGFKTTVKLSFMTTVSGKAIRLKTSK